MVTLTSCCCGLLPFRTGILIFLGLDAVFVTCLMVNMLRKGFRNVHLIFITIALIILVIHGFGIYGTMKEIPEYLKPLLVYLIAGAVLIGCFMILMVLHALFYAFFNSALQIIKKDEKAIVEMLMNETQNFEGMNDTQNFEKMNLTELLDSEISKLPYAFAGMSRTEFLIHFTLREIGSFLGIGLYIYMFIVVMNFQKELKKSKEPEEPKTPKAPKTLKTGKEISKN